MAYAIFSLSGSNDSAMAFDRTVFDRMARDKTAFSMILRSGSVISNLANLKNQKLHCDRYHAKIISKNVLRFSTKFDLNLHSKFDFLISELKKIQQLFCEVRLLFDVHSIFFPIQTNKMPKVVPSSILVIFGGSFESCQLAQAIRMPTRINRAGASSSNQNPTRSAKKAAKGRRRSEKNVSDHGDCAKSEIGSQVSEINSDMLSDVRSIFSDSSTNTKTCPQRQQKIDEPRDGLSNRAGCLKVKKPDYNWGPFESGSNDELCWVDLKDACSTPADQPNSSRIDSLLRSLNLRK